MGMFDTLLKTVKVDLPQILVDEEVNIQLARLLDEVRALGMTIEQYLKAKKLTHQQLRAEYQKTTQEMLRLNLALEAIATRQGYTEKNRISKAVEYLTSL